MPRLKIKTTKNIEGGFVAEWKDGKESTFLIADLPERMVVQCAIHGLKQKLMDEHSDAARQGMSIADCREISESLFEVIKSGDWSPARESGGWVAKALAEITGEDLETAIEKLSAMSENERKQVAKHPEIVAWKAERDLERAKARANTDTDQVVLNELF